MSKHRVLLADSSYTIRRIVELSFSEESDIELITFESGNPLKEKLNELNPSVVLVDIRLPEFNGYQVCKFINENEGLSNTRVFLLKGGFEPVNEDLLKELKYHEIVTKPFDSNALVKSVKEVLSSEAAPAAPPVGDEEISDSFPEDLPEISGFEEEAVDEISFSDVNDVVTSEPEATPKKKSDTEDFVRDDVLPSEEITQGAQPERDDTLRPDTAEDMANPFQEDAKESNIDELLEREIERERQAHEDPPEMGTPQAEAFDFEPVGPTEIPGDKAEAGEPQIPELVESATGMPPSLQETPADGATPDTLSEEELAQAFAEAAEPRQADDIFAPPAEAGEETPPPIPESPPEIEIPSPKEPEISIPAPPGEDTETERIMADLDASARETEPPAPSPPPPTPEPRTDSTGEIVDPEALVNRMEDKLSVAIKEILWEVVPPLAEKIIKQEIQRLESEIESSDT